MGNRPRIASIHILDDDSLLHVFYLYRPFLLGEDGDELARFEGGTDEWVRGRWWYKLAHVCQRWRYLLLGSASYLGIPLVCSYGTPVADMIAHSPPLPLFIDYSEKKRDITAEDEEQMIFAFKQRDRVSRVRLLIKTNQERLIAAMEDEYPMLEYLIVKTPNEDNSTILTFPETLQAPHLRHLMVSGLAFPTGSQLLTSAMSLVTLCLVMGHRSTYFHPNVLLQWISSMSQLESLVIRFSLPVHQRDVERQITLTPITTLATLPNLHHFRFEGVGTYLEALLRRISAPHVERLEIKFFSQLTFFVPRLQQLMNTAENLKFDTAKLKFGDKRVFVALSPREVEMFPLALAVKCFHLDWQVSSMAQISNSLSQVFSALDHLVLEHEVHSRSSEEHNEIDRTEWRKLLGPFSKVKTLRIAKGLVEAISRCLQLEDGELPLDLLPELQELTFPQDDNNGDAFTSFISARENTDHAVTVVPP
jgi:hypothetical protein